VNETLSSSLPVKYPHSYRPPILSRTLTLQILPLISQKFSYLASVCHVFTLTDFCVHEAQPQAGTENNVLVRNYIMSTLKSLDWTIEEDAFNDTTPLGNKPFTNIIATKDPRASRRVIVAAHFDSKYFPHPPADQVCMLQLITFTSLETDIDWKN
jgi:hypothetical protein